MTEKDFEIQQLTRENAEVRKQRDLLMQENDELRKELHELKERMKPKKPYDINEDMKTFDCPNCLSSLWAENELVDCGFCPICGQALDWSDGDGT